MCSESLMALKNTEQLLRNMLSLQSRMLDLQTALYNQKEQPGISSDGGWTIKTQGKSVIYERQETYSGSTLTINCDFPRGMSVKRIDQIWNDTTAKTLSVRLYSDTSNAYYSELKAATGDTNTSIILSPTTDGELRFPPAGRLQFYYSTYTGGKIMKIVVVGELP